MALSGKHLFQNVFANYRYGQLMLHHYHSQARNYLLCRLVFFFVRERKQKTIFIKFYFETENINLTKNLIQWSQQVCIYLNQKMQKSFKFRSSTQEEKNRSIFRKKRLKSVFLTLVWITP